MEARIHAKIEAVPISASVAGRRIIPEPIMLMAVTVVSCTTPIFLLLDKVVPFFLNPNRMKRIGGKILSRNKPDDAVMKIIKACTSPICFL